MSERILIVDDDPSNVEKLYSLLQSNDFDIAVANNGERAYKVALNFKPDLVLMDVLMPGWDGYETTKVFKSDPQLQNIPIIFVTAKPEEAQKTFEHGAADYIVKPFSNEELNARVRFHLRTSKSWQQMQRNNTVLTLNLNLKERELIKAQQQITALKQQLKKDSSNIPQSIKPKTEPGNDQKSLSDEEFEKKFNKP
jgi:DNA-binding response OmpR family regulator